MTDLRQEMAGYLRGQADACAMIGSALYERMLDGAAVEVERGATLWNVLEPFATGPDAHGVPLKLMGALHRLALEGRAPALARIYPSTGGSVDLDQGVAALVETVAEHADELGNLISRPVQTNEVGRATALWGGFIEVARQTGLPLRLLELGASAGLNLRWDRYLYEAGDRRWGNPNSNVRLELDPSQAPLCETDAIVGSRRGCDTAPLDPASEQDRLTLLSYLWPDQTWRVELLRAALAEAAAMPVLVERADAAQWIDDALQESVPKTATVVFHSLFLFWADEPVRDRISATIRAAGERATRHRPLAWLEMEYGGKLADLHLTLWPGGERRLIARAGYHGRPVRWVGR